MHKSCTVPGCNRPGACRSKKLKARVCRGHWAREEGLVDPNKPIGNRMKSVGRCVVAGCDRPSKAKRMCKLHYARDRAQLKSISLDSPIRPNGRGLSVIIPVRLPAYAGLALNARSKSTRVPVSHLVRAIVERWAQTDGALQKQAQGDDYVGAWARRDYAPDAAI